jgi:hypothetical protein
MPDTILEGDHPRIIIEKRGVGPFLAHLAFRPCELLPSLSDQKPLVQLQPNFGGMVLGWPPSKIVSGANFP